MRPIKAGKLRDRLTLKRKSLTGSNAFKSRTQTVTDVCKLWGNVIINGAGEVSGPDKTDHEVTYTIETRYNASIKPTDYLEWNNQTLEVTSVIDAGNRNRLTVLQ